MFEFTARFNRAQPYDALGLGFSPRRRTPPNQGRNECDMRDSNQRDIAPKPRLFRHLFRFSFCGDADLADPGTLHRLHQSDQFLHRQITIRSNDDRDARIRLF